MVVGVHANADVGGPCAGHDVDYTWRQCGRPGSPYSSGRCVLRARGTDPRSAGRPGRFGLTPAATTGRRDRQDRAPFSAIRWITYSPNARLLTRLATEDRPMSRELLDELAPSRNQQYIRQILVHTGVLPERHEDLERLPAWLEHELADRPTAHANLVRPFLNWFQLRRARQRAQCGVTAPRPTATSCDASASPSKFLAWPKNTN